MNELRVNDKTFLMKDCGNNGIHYLNDDVMKGRARKQSSLWKMIW